MTTEPYKIVKAICMRHPEKGPDGKLTPRGVKCAKAWATQSQLRRIHFLRAFASDEPPGRTMQAAQAMIEELGKDGHQPPHELVEDHGLGFSWVDSIPTCTWPPFDSSFDAMVIRLMRPVQVFDMLDGCPRTLFIRERIMQTLIRLAVLTAQGDKINNQERSFLVVGHSPGVDLLRPMDAPRLEMGAGLIVPLRVTTNAGHQAEILFDQIDYITTPPGF